jgi:hypothetical protein
MKTFRQFISEEKHPIFSEDHVRTIAHWAERLGLKAAQKSGYDLYHKMKTNKKVSVEEIGSISMSILDMIKSKEKDKKMYYDTLRAWGLN